MTEIDPERAEQEAQPCPSCSAPVERSQEYCLSCGVRLPRDRSGAVRAPTVPQERRSWSAGWVAPVLVALVVAVLGTGAAMAISDGGGERDAVSVATGGNRPAPEPTTTLTPPEPTAPSATTAPARPRRTSPPRAPATTAWPADRRGWTIVLLSLPQSAGRALAEERAAEARRKGLTDVGILNSSRFPSLHSGYFVVFTGVYDAQPEATSALPRARAAFPLAYAREIVP